MLSPIELQEGGPSRTRTEMSLGQRILNPPRLPFRQEALLSTYNKEEFTFDPAVVISLTENPHENSDRRGLQI